MEVLEAGFSRLLNHYNVTQLQGRGNVEREIRTLQEAEGHGEIDTLKCFIFDLDDAPTHLARVRGLIRVTQWSRHCIENYLINENAIYEILRDDDISRDKIEKRGEVSAIFREIAFQQLNDTVATIVYKHMGSHPGPPSQKELFNKSFAESGAMLFDRINRIKQQICNLQAPEWRADFEGRCEQQLSTLRPKWDVEWVSLCDGKRFFR